MARVAMTGYEVYVKANSGEPGPDIGPSGSSGTITRDTGVARSGAASLKCDSTASNLTARAAVPGLTVESTGPFTNFVSNTYFVRAYYRFNTVFGTPIRIMSICNFPNGISVILDTAGNIAMQREDTSAQFTGSGIVAFDATTWYRVEVKLVTNASSEITDCEFRLDGTTICTGSGLTLATSNSLLIGLNGSVGANITCNVDDVAVNDSSGANQNTWCGNGKIVLLVPTSDSAVGTGWTNDAAGTTNLFNAVKNTPPTGIADTTASTGLHQIRNATSNANVNYDANMTTYTAAGIGAGDTINVVVPVVETGAPVTTSAKAGTVGIVSNPAVANVNLSTAPGTSGAFWSGVTAGTFGGTGWKTSWGTVTHSPSVTLGTSPVMRITQVTSSTRIAMVCFMGIYVDYTPAIVTSLNMDLFDRRTPRRRMIQRI